MKTTLLPFLALGALIALVVHAGKSAAAGPEQAGTPKVPTASSSETPADPNKEATVPEDTSASRNAARTRMRECGHQWSTMKKSGAASGMTWKDFSQNCLARK